MKKPWEQMTVKELEAEVRQHNRLYFVEHAPEISDVEFDHLVELLRSRAPDSKALLELTSDVRPGSTKIRHVVPMLSLDKCYDEESLQDWLAKFEGDVIASPKVDGLAVSLRYEQGKLVQAVTRGDGIEGEEITANVRFIKAIPQSFAGQKQEKLEVRGEIYMPLSVFSSFRDQFANPRNLAAGGVKQKDAAKTAEYGLGFFAYDLLDVPVHTETEKLQLLHKAGFPELERKYLKREGLQEAFEYFSEKRSRYDFETDGVVFKADLVSEQQRLGVTAHHPRYAIAYKFQGDSGVTTLLDVEWSVARTGAITPVALVEPVELSGAMVRRASLHNVGILRKLMLTKGAKVVMMRRGGVIPNVESVATPGDEAIAIPKVCPSCGEAIREDDDVLYCTNAKNCVRSKVGELEHFVKTIGIDGFGEKLILKLYETGLVTDPAEFYDLTPKDLLDLERMGETLAVKLVRNVQAHQMIPLSDFLQSLGIRELGRHAASLLAQRWTLREVRSATEEDLAALHTFGEVIAREVVQGLREKSGVIDKLLERVEVVQGTPVAISGSLAAKSYLFTGELLAMKRSEAQRLVEEHGGVAAQSVNQDLDFLVVGDGGGAGSKVQKAQKLREKGGKVQIISESEFLAQIRSAKEGA